MNQSYAQADDVITTDTPETLLTYLHSPRLSKDSGPPEVWLFLILTTGNAATVSLVIL
jgi:hypothetical protein